MRLKDVGPPTSSVRGFGCVGMCLYLMLLEWRAPHDQIRKLRPAEWVHRSIALQKLLLMNVRFGSKCEVRSQGRMSASRRSRGAVFENVPVKLQARGVDLPVDQSSRFEFVINRETAKALGLEISRKLIGVADEVIE